MSVSHSFSFVGSPPFSSLTLSLSLSSALSLSLCLAPSLSLSSALSLSPRVSLFCHSAGRALRGLPALAGRAGGRAAGVGVRVFIFTLRARFIYVHFGFSKGAPEPAHLGPGRDSLGAAAQRHLVGGLGSRVVGECR